MNIQNKMKELFGGSCYGYCIAWLFGENSTLKFLTSAFLEGWNKGFISDDGWVNNPLKYIRMISGTQYQDVKKPPIKDKSDIPTEPTIVEMACPSGGSHFVVCHRQGKEVVLDFDPSGLSNSWKSQNFISYRVYC